MASAAPPDVLRSPALKSGDLVAVVSPSAAPDEAHLQATVAELESWGLRVDVGANALARHGITAGTDVQRLSDLNRAFAASSGPTPVWSPSTVASAATRSLATYGDC